MSNLIDFYKKPEVKKYAQKYENPCYDKTKIKHPFRAILIGASGSGKTQTLMNIIKNMGGTWDFIVLCVKSAQEPLYEYLLNKCRGSIALYEEGKLPTVEDIDKISDKGKDQVLIVYDDLCLMKDQKAIEEAYIRFRKKNCSMIYLSQSYFKIPKTIRVNCNLIFLKKLSSNRDLKMILKEYDVGVSEKQLMEMYKIATDNQLDFLTIRIDENWDSPYKFTRNFSCVLE